jgi:hypothetical protein
VTVSAHSRVRDHVSQSFLLLTGSIADGTVELASSGKEYGVLAAPAGHVRILLATAKDSSTPSTW